MPYPEELVAPLREELTSLGVKELRTADEVDAFMANRAGTAMLIFNSVCGCAAGSARPAVKLAFERGKRPDRAATVFAGQDLDAVAAARKHLPSMPASSPSIALLRDGELADYISREKFKGKDAETVSAELVQALDQLAGARA